MSDDLPMGWTKCSLGTVISVKNGYAFKSSDYSTEGIPLVRISDIQEGKINLKKSVFIPKERANLDFTVQNGDLLIAMSGATTGKVGIYTGKEICLQNQRVGNFKILSRQLLNTRFRDFYILSLGKKIEDAAYGGAQPNISSSVLESFEILLPPLNEQQRIVDKLDRLGDHHRTARNELSHIPKLIARYKQAVLAAAFGGNLTADWREENPDTLTAKDFLLESGIQLTDEFYLPSLPDTWTWVRAGNLCSIKSGVALGKKRNPGTQLLELPYLKVANVQRGWLDLQEVKTILVTPKEAEALYLNTGDILMNEGGDRDKLGRGWVWEGQVSNCIHQNHVFRLRLRTSKIPPHYISYYANEFGQKYFMDQGKQTTNLASISMSKLSNLPLPIAPPKEMELILRLIEKLFKAIDRIEQEYQKASVLLDRLEQTTLGKAFRGELVPQDPNDEPAAILLERIRRERPEQPKTKTGKSRRKPQTESL